MGGTQSLRRRHFQLHAAIGGAKIVMTGAAPFVHIVDDDWAIRESLTMLLESEGFQTHCFASAVSFLQALPKLEFGCVVSDVRMPGMSGLELLTRMKELNVQQMPVVMITGYADVSVAVEAMKLGAVDFFEKPCTQEELVAVVRAALACAGDAQEQEARNQAYLKRLETLSVREHDVLAGLLEGKLNKTIAYEMGVSVRTVESHRAEIMAKTETTSLSELVRVSLLSGWK
jgi:two-component system response regulator FixJ